MNRSFQRCFLVIVFPVTLSAFSLLLPRSHIGSGEPVSFRNRMSQVIRNPRRAYTLWRVDRETQAVKKLLRDADICLQVEGDGFTCTKPLGPDGRPILIPSKDIAISPILRRKSTPLAVTIQIPATWSLKGQTTNPSGTEMEDFALEVAAKARACGFPRITVYEGSYGMFLRVFDGEIPSRVEIDSMVRRQIAMLSGL